jgi:putative ABC transport system permease protein
MFKNYLKIAFRNLRRHKLYSLINVSGMAIGMACCLLIILFIQDELSYDRFNEKADQIYRVAKIETRNDETVNYPLVFPVMAPKLKEEFPEVLDAVRFDRQSSVAVARENIQFIEPRFFYADANVFDMFTFPLVQGDAKTALQDPYCLVLTEDMARKYFGRENPVGKTLTIDNKEDYRVTGVLKNLPHTSHIKFDFLASICTMEAENPRYGKLWAWSCYTYLLLPRGYSPSELERKLPDFVRRHRNEEAAKALTFYLQPLTKIHLHSNLAYEIESNGDIRSIYIFSAIAFFILLIACINFMNLATARSAHRAKEVGLRKVLGADRRQLARQFLGESFILSIFALLIAVALVELSLPAFSALTGKAVRINYIDNGLIPLGLAGLLFFVGIVSGSYPAFFLSAFHPAEILRGKFRAGLKSSFFRKFLVVTQFSISIVLIVSTVVVYTQLDFIRNKKLGFDKEHLIVLSVGEQEMRAKYEAFRNGLLQNSRILSVAASTSFPGLIPTISKFVPEGAEDKEPLTLRNMLVDYDFIKTFGMEIKEGRDFSRHFPTDAREAFLINETAARQFGWDSAVGKKLTDLDGGSGQVIGVIRDFHFRSKHQRIEPLILSILPDNRFIYFISVKLGPGNLQESLSFLKEEWRKYSAGRPLEYVFLDENFDKLYGAEQKLSRLFSAFSFLAILIACLGLFGLASFASEQRTKEIGVRKTLGASVANIVLLFSREFTRWVLVANVLAWPIAYFAMSRWLQSFAYRVDIRLWMFLLAASLALAIALLTVSFQAMKAALANPVDALRYE